MKSNIQGVFRINVFTEAGMAAHTVKKDKFTLGRSRDSDIAVRANGVSRLHVEVEYVKGKVWVTDKGSSNGTHINGATMSAHQRSRALPDTQFFLGSSGLYFTVEYLTDSEAAMAGSFDTEKSTRESELAVTLDGAVPPPLEDTLERPIAVSDDDAGGGSSPLKRSKASIAGDVKKSKDEKNKKQKSSDEEDELAIDQWEENVAEDTIAFQTIQKSLLKKDKSPVLPKNQWNEIDKKHSDLDKKNWVPSDVDSDTPPPSEFTMLIQDFDQQMDENNDNFKGEEEELIGSSEKSPAGILKLDAESASQHLLGSAKKEAQEIVDQAMAQRKQILDEAKVSGRSILDDYQMKSAEVRLKSQDQAQNFVDDAREKIESEKELAKNLVTKAERDSKEQTDKASKILTETQEKIRKLREQSVLKAQSIMEEARDSKQEAKALEIEIKQKIDEERKRADVAIKEGLDKASDEGQKLLLAARNQSMDLKTQADNLLATAKDKIEVLTAEATEEYKSAQLKARSLVEKAEQSLSEAGDESIALKEAAKEKVKLLHAKAKEQLKLADEKADTIINSANDDLQIKISKAEAEGEKITTSALKDSAECIKNGKAEAESILLHAKNEAKEEIRMGQEEAEAFELKAQENVKQLEIRSHGKIKIYNEKVKQAKEAAEKILNDSKNEADLETKFAREEADSIEQKAAELLETAQLTAKEVMTEAEGAASDELKKSRIEAADRIRNSQSKVSNIVKDANDKASSIIDSAEDEATALVAKKRLEMKDLLSESEKDIGQRLNDCKTEIKENWEKANEKSKSIISESKIQANALQEEIRNEVERLLSVAEERATNIREKAKTAAGKVLDKRREYKEDVKLLHREMEDLLREKEDTQKSIDGLLLQHHNYQVDYGEAQKKWTAEETSHDKKLTDADRELESLEQEERQQQGVLKGLNRDIEAAKSQKNQAEEASQDKITELKTLRENIKKDEDLLKEKRSSLKKRLNSLEEKYSMKKIEQEEQFNKEMQANQTVKDNFTKETKKSRREHQEKTRKQVEFLERELKNSRSDIAAETEEKRQSWIQQAQEHRDTLEQELKNTREFQEQESSRLLTEVQAEVQRLRDKANAEVSASREALHHQSDEYKEKNQTALERTKLDIEELKCEALKERDQILSEAHQTMKLAEDNAVQLRQDIEKNINDLKNTSDKDMKVKLEKAETDFQNRLQYEEGKLAGTRLKNIKAEKEDKAKRVKEEKAIKKHQAGEIARHLESRIASRLKKDGASSSMAGDSGLGDEIQKIVSEALGIDGQGALGPSAGVTQYSSETQKKKREYWRRVGAATAMVLAFLATVKLFPNFLPFVIIEVGKVLSVDQSALDLYISKQLDQQRNKPKFDPEKTTQFRDSYWENLLYTQGYIEMEEDQKSQEKWILKVNEFFLSSLKLNEESIVKLIGVESNLLIDLKEIQRGINPDFVDEGEERLREIEDLAEGKFLAIVRTKSKMKKFWEFKKAFYEDYIGLSQAGDFLDLADDEESESATSKDGDENRGTLVGGKQVEENRELASSEDKKEDDRKKQKLESEEASKTSKGERLGKKDSDTKRDKKKLKRKTASDAGKKKSSRTKKNKKRSRKKNALTKRQIEENESEIGEDELDELDALLEEY